MQIRTNESCSESERFFLYTFAVTRDDETEEENSQKTGNEQTTTEFYGLLMAWTIAGTRQRTNPSL